MAVKINKKLTIGKNIEIPAGAVVVPTVNLIKPQPYKDEEDQIKFRRLITYVNFLYQSVEDYQNDFNGNGNLWVNEIPSGWEKEMTDEEFALLTTNALTAEMWLINHFNQILGGEHCELINASNYN